MEAPTWRCVVTTNELNFEQAFARLETILEKMNSGNVPLDESLKLYEEADKLISSCSHKLSSAEERIETLIKKRNGELEMEESGLPKAKAFEIEEALS